MVTLNYSYELAIQLHVACKKINECKLYIVIEQNWLNKLRTFDKFEFFPDLRFTSGNFTVSFTSLSWGFTLFAVFSSGKQISGSLLFALCCLETISFTSNFLSSFIWCDSGCNLMVFLLLGGIPFLISFPSYLLLYSLPFLVSTWRSSLAYKIRT